MRIYKIASPETDIRDLKSDIKDLKKDVKDAKKDLKDLDRLSKKIVEMEKTIKDLNIGNRRFWQEKTSFTSLQRKLEKIEKMEQEWIRYKADMKDSIRREIEQTSRASIHSLDQRK